jgi:hypothetical protein
MTEHSTSYDPPLSDRERALLVGLADGTSSTRRRRRAEALVRRLDGGADLVDRQRRVMSALAGGPVPPLGLAPEAAPIKRRRGLPLPRVFALATAAGVAAAIALALTLVVSPGGTPTVAAIAELGARPALGTPPPPRPSEPRLLAASFDGVSFPNWGGEFGWRATGSRSDDTNGRASRTVFYEHMGHRIGYTVVERDSLEIPAGSERVRRNGVEVALVHDRDHQSFAVFVRDGHTCVLSGHFLRLSTLVELASWRGGGNVAF